MRVRIPSIGVDSELLDLGLQADGTMEVPEGGFPAGWYVNAPTPGELGPAILAGHVDMGGEPGVFYRLRDLQAGAEVSVTRADGSVPVFRVTGRQVSEGRVSDGHRVRRHRQRGAAAHHLRWRVRPLGRSYVDNIVVYADLVGTRTL